MPHPELRLFDAGGELLLIEPSALARPWPPFVPEPEPGDRPRYRRDGQVAIVQIDGPLDQRGYAWWWDGYEAVAARVCAALLDPQIGAVVLRIDSPGGVVAGCFEAVATMRRAKESAGKKVFVVVDEQCCSAAYALAMVGDQISLPETGEVGSVGVVATYVNRVEQLAQQGVRVAVLTSGAQKADGSPLVPWDKVMLARLQAEVDELAAIFFRLVAERRHLKPEAVKALEAAVFRGQAAVAAGLADIVQAPAEVLEAAREAAAAFRRPLITTARASAEKAPDPTMLKNIALALGLAEDASEAQILAALASITPSKAQLDELCAAVGKPTVSEALGAVRGLVEARGQLDQLVAERAKEQKAALDAAVEAVFAWAEENGRRTPAQVAAAKKSMEAGVLKLETLEAVAAYRAELEAGPVVLPGKEAPQASSDGNLVGQRWEDMSNAEKHRLYNDPAGRAVYDAVLADYRARKGANRRPSVAVRAPRVAPTGAGTGSAPIIPPAAASKAAPAAPLAAPTKPSQSLKGSKTKAR